MARGLRLPKIQFRCIDDQAQIKRHAIPSPFHRGLLTLDYRIKGGREIEFQTMR